MADGVRVEWSGPQAKAAVHRGLARGVRRVAEQVGEASQRVVPRESSRLAKSMAVSQDDLVAAVSYDTPYAVKQHENLRLRHARGQTGKYLENPLHAAARTAAQVVAAEVAREAEAR